MRSKSTNANFSGQTIYTGIDVHKNHGQSLLEVITIT